MGSGRPSGAIGKACKTAQEDEPGDGRTLSKAVLPDRKCYAVTAGKLSTLAIHAGFELRL